MIRDEYKEILVLRDMLQKENIPFEVNNGYLNGVGIAYPNREKFICSAIENDISYGRHEDTIEIMGLLTEEEGKYDDVVGHLTAKDVFLRIKNHYTNN